MESEGVVVAVVDEARPWIEEPGLQGIYQLPQRSLAISGKGWKALATEATKVASAWIECRRFVIRRLERLSSVRTVLRSLVWEGKMMVFSWEAMGFRSIPASPLLGGRLNAGELRLRSRFRCRFRCCCCSGPSRTATREMRLPSINVVLKPRHERRPRRKSPE
ncbi:hypothetical protein KC358_g89 [Hortaea werneckii]|nr:hypothetical protein KC358_g89 [Hortaea werneckii]